MMKKFSNVVERARALQEDSTTVEFAAKLGMTQQTVDLYLKGARKPSLEFVYNLCKTFDVSADWLLGLSTTNEERRSTDLNAQSTARDIERLRADAAQVCIRADSFTAAIDNLKETLQRFSPAKS